MIVYTLPYWLVHILLATKTFPPSATHVWYRRSVPVAFTLQLLLGSVQKWGGGGMEYMCIGSPYHITEDIYSCTWHFLIKRLVSLLLFCCTYSVCVGSIFTDIPLRHFYLLQMKSIRPQIHSKRSFVNTFCYLIPHAYLIYLYSSRYNLLKIY